MGVMKGTLRLPVRVIQPLLPGGEKLRTWKSGKGIASRRQPQPPLVLGIRNYGNCHLPGLLINRPLNVRLAEETSSGTFPAAGRGDC